MIDEQTFRDAASKFASGVTVVTTSDGSRMAGITVSAFASLSLRPPQVFISIGHDTGVHDFLRDNGVFTVNVLDQGQIFLSRHFADDTREKITPRFEGVDVRAGATGCPVLEGVLAHLDCRVTGSLVAADHSIFIGAVEAAGHREDGAPLIHWARGYRRIALAE